LAEWNEKEQEKIEEIRKKKKGRKNNNGRWRVNDKSKKGSSYILRW
jgi:hypothetical protein